jgi:conjugal transfer pilin signal peptidase TrbI
VNAPSIPLQTRWQAGANFLGDHVARTWRLYLLGILAMFSLQHFFALGFNGSDSLPEQVFLIKKWDRGNYRVGDYVAYRWHGDAPYPRGTIMVKIIGGIAGDEVTAIDRVFSVNGVVRGRAKEVSKKGIPLQIGPTGRIPGGQMYLYTTSKDSLDSRYDLVGWPNEAQVIGRAIPIL